jgi:hypothetical protein
MILGALHTRAPNPVRALPLQSVLRCFNAARDMHVHTAAGTELEYRAGLLNYELRRNLRSPITKPILVSQFRRKAE